MDNQQTSERSAGKEASRKRGWAQGCGWLFIAILPWIILETHGHAQNISPYDLKAAYILNFARFVEWPQTAFEDATSPITIAVFGRHNFGNRIEAAIRNETVRGRSLEASYFSEMKKIPKCHILFIGEEEASRAQALLSAVKGSSVLTVGETEDFLRRGGMVGMITEGKKINMKFNLEPAKAAQLTISSKLLRLGRIYRPE